MQNRIEVFEQMLETDPSNTMVMFGLAKEYEKAEAYEKVVSLLEKYLAESDDEGNAYGMLAKAYEKTGQSDKARAALIKGIEVSNAHGHPSMAEDYRMNLEMNYAD